MAPFLDLINLLEWLREIWETLLTRLPIYYEKF